MKGVPLFLVIVMFVKPLSASMVKLRLFGVGVADGFGVGVAVGIVMLVTSKRHVVAPVDAPVANV